MSEPETEIRSGEAPAYDRAAVPEPGGHPGAASRQETRESFYSDAHYEPAGSTTAPPRFYTPPVRQPRPRREKQKREGKRFGAAAVLGMCLACTLLGGFFGAGLLYLLTDGRLTAMEYALVETARISNENSEAITALEEQQNGPNQVLGVPEERENGPEQDRGYLGVRLDDDYDAMAALYFKLPPGAFVEFVEDDSAAASAGLRSGDIILALDGVPVECAADLRALLGDYHPGDPAELTLYRAGSSKPVAVVFGERPSSDGEGRP